MARRFVVRHRIRAGLSFEIEPPQKSANANFRQHSQRWRFHQLHLFANKMTAEVNAAAAACPHATAAAATTAAPEAACPHAAAAAAPEAACPHAGGDAQAKEKSGFGSQMMSIAQHAAAGGAWEVTGSMTREKASLSLDREVSSIPKSDFTPAHQTGTQSYWEYPSEEMYYKAMQRKGWSPEAEQMKTIVAIHNTVNEQSWREVLQWEAMHATATQNTQPPKLKRFIGRPSDFSPKARILNALGWSVLPFDRHDWIVEREDGTEVRYVIDFYTGQPQPGKPLSVYLDVRPALDSVESAFDRLRWQFEAKIKPLLPFRGAIFGQKEEANATPVTTQGRSTVIPRSDA